MIGVIATVRAHEREGLPRQRGRTKRTGRLGLTSYGHQTRDSPPFAASLGPIYGLRTRPIPETAYGRSTPLHRLASQNPTCPARPDTPLSARLPNHPRSRGPLPRHTQVCARRCPPGRCVPPHARTVRPPPTPRTESATPPLRVAHHPVGDLLGCRRSSGGFGAYQPLYAGLSWVSSDWSVCR